LTLPNVAESFCQCSIASGIVDRQSRKCQVTPVEETTCQVHRKVIGQSVQQRRPTIIRKDSGLPLKSRTAIRAWQLLENHTQLHPKQQQQRQQLKKSDGFTKQQQGLQKKIG